MARIPQNACHPMAAQARVKAQLAKEAAEKGEQPKPPAPPAPPAPKPSTAITSGGGLSNKEKLDTLPDEDLLALANTHSIADPHTLGRAKLIEKLDAAGVTIG